jgi:uncharacterized protein
MKSSFDYLRAAAAISILASTLVACGSSAPTRFYTLSPMAPEKPVVADVSGNHRTVVGVGAVEIPDYLDRPQVVTRTSQNQLVLSECDLWGGSLKADVNRIILEDLTRVLPPERFSVVTMKRGVPIDCRVTVSIIRLDVGLEEGVVLHAQWVLAGRDGNGDGAFRSTRLTEPTTTKDIQGAVAAMSLALGRLSGEIATHIGATVK